MDSSSSSDPHPEVPEFAVMVLDGSRHPSLNATAGSGVIYRSGADRQLNAVNSSRHNYKELYSPCFAPANELILTANKYLKKRDQPLLKLGELNNWIDVENSMVSACNTLDTLSSKDHDTSGFTGKIKWAFRTLCQKAEIGSTFVSMVPNEVPCSSVLCGGLKAVFTALERSHNYREDVYKAIEDIPYIINDHAVYIDIHAEDEELHRRSAALYVSLFNLMQHILLWFIKNPVVTGIKFLLTPQGFAEGLKDRMTDIKRTAARFEKHALFLRNIRHDESMKLQHWMAHKLGKTSEDMALIRDRSEVLENLCQLLQELHPGIMGKGARRQHKLEMASREDVPSTKEARNDLLEKLAFDEHLLINDYKNLLSIRKGSGGGLDAERILTMQNHPQLQAWMSLNRSSVLLVDGGCAVSGDCEISYVSAQILESILQLSRQADHGNNTSNVFVLPLAFFCSQHRNRRRDMFGRPKGLITALLSQLIDQFHGFGAKQLQASQNDLANDDIEGVCKAFRRLVKKLPATSIVVLVLEGIDVLMEEKTRSALRYILHSLLETHSGKHAATLKFLFTCTTSSEPVVDLFEEWDVLRIPQVLQTRGSYRNFMWKDSGKLDALASSE
ncbi:uncharacterized protein GGS22DRAFT_109444 [Annulohypoxylon maeteangense]|uniref:uncharacterized protein n=1 Tax=Annulohypoxylon maeteangense TaxID=1927788 RepID=UPI00200872CE|nr:uncharacterized protein GGS22DRAFT_109444 [Annulohypoxylon maeteangense]KAI0887432.1 hypothetical protein GGS22DRAFT_109444 [Annulohypoxylon maeteangense]